MSELQQYKCPCCDGGIEFDTKTQNMKCPYCGTEFEVETLKEYDEILKNEPHEDNMEWNSATSSEWQEDEKSSICSYVCNSCGGELICDLTTAATDCPYCGNPVVMMDRFTGDLRPELVIPFKFDKKAATAALEKHLSGKRLLPKTFKSQKHLDEIKGIYVPFWIFDTKAKASIRYKATRVRAWSDSNYHYTETTYYSVGRSGDIAFEHIPADGSSKFDDALMESIEPFDLSQAVDFQTAYLSGFFADKYDVTSDDCKPRINLRVKKSTEDAFASTVVGYNSVIPVNSSVNFEDSSVKYALYPVWLLNTTWNGQKYTFAMNGQTGKFVGDLPVDKGAWFRWFGLISAIGAVGSVILFALGKGMGLL